MKYRSALALLLTLTANFAMAATPDGAGKTPNALVHSRATPVPKDFFGLIIHRSHTAGRWPAMPFGSLRLWDSYLKWMDIQPAPNTWRFENFDHQVELARQNGVDMIHTLGQTPAWASVAEQERHAYGPGSGGMPKNIDDWQVYVEKVVSRYKGKIFGYEIWNEPKFSEGGKCKGAIFFCGTPEDLVQLTSVAHKTIKQIDPGAVIASPGFTDGLHGVKRLDQYLAAGGAKYVEAISFHFYELHPEKAWDTYLALRAVMAKHHLSHLPIWNTEVGYLIQNQENSLEKEHPQGPFSVVFSPEAAAGRLARVMLISASAGAARVYWYAWDNKRMGLIGTQDGLPNSAASGYRVVRRWLLGSSVSCQQTTSRAWSCNLLRDRRTATVYWSEDDQVTISLPGIGDKAMEDLGEGRRTVKGGANIRWNGSPILISEDGMPWYPKQN